MFDDLRYQAWRFVETQTELAVWLFALVLLVLVYVLAQKSIGFRAMLAAGVLAIVVYVLLRS